MFVATLSPTRPLTLLAFSKVLPEAPGVTEFEILDMAIHMLFLVKSHAYEITRSISHMASEAGFDGIVYPSYFSFLRTRSIPFETTYRISGQIHAPYTEHEQSKIVLNIALFGRPVAEGKVMVKCINRLLLARAHYDLKFGPAGVV